MSVTKEKGKVSVYSGAQQPQSIRENKEMPGAQQPQAYGNDEIVTAARQLKIISISGDPAVPAWGHENTLSKG